DDDEARARCASAGDPDRRVLVAQVGPGDACPEIVGYGFWFAWSGSAPVLGLGIPDAWQGRGVGPVVLDALLGEARGAGKPRVRLSVYKENMRARTLYASRGFVVDGETDDGLQWTMSAVP
ncbi:MAG: N-acetyltransferase family protein, partial [Armatimonadota bacterium]